MGGFDFGVIRASLPFLLEGMGITLLLTLGGLAGGFTGGVVLAVVRQFNIPVLAQVGWAYVAFFRSMPFVLILFWIYFLLPLVLGFPVGAFTAALVSFVVFEIAYFSEIIRAGIGAVSVGQRQAGEALGLTRLQAYRYVIVPQAIRRMRPALLTQIVVLFQDTSLVYVVGLRDFLVSADIVANRDARMVEMYSFVALVYFVLCLAGTRAVARLRAT